MTEPTQEQLKQLHKDIMSGRVMIVEVEHYNKLDDGLSKAYERIKELEAKLKKHGDHKDNCDYLRGKSIEDCDCGFDQAQKGK